MRWFRHPIETPLFQPVGLRSVLLRIADQSLSALTDRLENAPPTCNRVGGRSLLIASRETVGRSRGINPCGILEALDKERFMKRTALSTALALSAAMLFQAGSAQAASRSKHRHNHHHHHAHHAAHHACMFHMIHGHGSMHDHSGAKAAAKTKREPRTGHQH